MQFVVYGSKTIEVPGAVYVSAEQIVAIISVAVAAGGDPAAIDSAADQLLALAPNSSWRWWRGEVPFVPRDKYDRPKKAIILTVEYFPKTGVPTSDGRPIPVARCKVPHNAASIADRIAVTMIWRNGCGARGHFTPGTLTPGYFEARWPIHIMDGMPYGGQAVYNPSRNNVWAAASDAAAREAIVDFRSWMEGRGWVCVAADAAGETWKSEPLRKGISAAELHKDRRDRTSDTEHRCLVRGNYSSHVSELERLGLALPA